MSFQKYLQTISTIDPGKIYVETIRSFMNVSTHRARTLCEMAVMDNLFIRKIGIVCPNDERIIEEFDSLNEIPDSITCHFCELEGKENCSFKTINLKKVTFYKLKNE